MQEAMPLLEVKNVSRYFGSLAAVDDLSFEVCQGEVFGIAGPNGSGKTTAINVITQIIPPSKGEIFFDGHPIHRLKSHDICHLGIARTFQQPTVFETMSIADNISVGGTFGKKGARDGAAEAEICRLLDFVGLDKDPDTPAKKLIVNDKKKLMLAVALATNPKLLILDEPCAGLTTVESKEIINLIKKVNDLGTTVMLIEHNMQVLMNISDRVMIIDHGTKLCQGTPDFVCCDARVIETYLGRNSVKGGKTFAGAE
ncbi:MAG: ABC transporter ATP-binding protein [Firmicutes bacterium HGW-Firmicutes-14]|nr:MAG: ABC transporter ATP-binding protein [Firmicutes bacterium HGW-Firmicutes-14]